MLFPHPFSRKPAIFPWKHRGVISWPFCWGITTNSPLALTFKRAPTPIPASSCHQWRHQERPLQHPGGLHCSNPSFWGWGGNYQHMIILFCLNYLPWKEAVWRGGDVKECVQLHLLSLILPRARRANLLRRKITSFSSSLSSSTPRS